VTLDNARIDASGKTTFNAPDVVARRAIAKPRAPTPPTKPIKMAKMDSTVDVETKVEKMPKEESQGGLKITDIKQTVAQMALEKGVSKEDAINAMLSKATDLNMKLVGW